MGEQRVEKPPLGTASYSLTNETFRCSCAIGAIEIKPDGYDHKIPETAYWDTLNLQAVDAHTVVLIAKKAVKMRWWAVVGARELTLRAGTI